MKTKSKRRLIALLLIMCLLLMPVTALVGNANPTESFYVTLEANPMIGGRGYEDGMIP